MGDETLTGMDFAQGDGKNSPVVEEQMRERLAAIRERIRDAAKASGRDESEITLIGVSKLFPAVNAMAAMNLGLFDLGENYARELAQKDDILKEKGYLPRWHLIGGLQSNKVKYVVGRTELIHSVASISLLDELDKRSEQCGVVSRILLQINVSGELSKQGFAPEEAGRMAEYAGNKPNLCLCGLMTMAPVSEDSHAAVPCFSDLKELFDRLAGNVPSLDCWKVLSMGMSGDFEDAIRFGATHVRIGTAIFGLRNYGGAVIP